MKKNIVIVGGGISGLAVLHNLKKKYARRDDIHIRLLEKEPRAGGTIQTRQQGGCLFEEGPNGFLNSKDSTLKLINEVGLEGEQLLANPEAASRYISLNRQLHTLPTGPGSLLGFKPLSLMDKLRMFREPFVPAGNDPTETVYEFGTRRLGEKFARYFLDPMARGVFGGDARQLNLKAAFPRIYELEQEHGSLIKAMVHIMRQKKSRNQGKAGQPSGQLCSLNKGMAQLVDALHAKYKDEIQTTEEATGIEKTEQGFCVKTVKEKYSADCLFLCLPAYGAAKLVKPWNETLSGLLQDIPYAPIAVAGLVYKRASFKKPLRGFGYLIPSCENNEVLGVLFSSNIFENRADKGHVLLRIMIGRNPDIAEKNHEDLLRLAAGEVKKMFAIEDGPVDQFIRVWPRGIPQYNAGYPVIREKIDREIRQYNNLYFTANYLDGIAMNDCTKNAQISVEKMQMS